MTDADPVLFDVPAAAPLRAPKAAEVGAGKIVYANYRPKQPERCSDCLQVALEANRAGTLAPVARSARCTRTQSGARLYLCVEHRDLRRDAEQAAAQAAELRARLLG